MDKIRNIIFGVSTYGPFPRVDLLMNSFTNNIGDIDRSKYNVTMVCVDDGTQNVGAVTDRMKACKKFQFRYVKHMSNFGIPHTWNNIASYTTSPDQPMADLAIIFNDDIAFLQPGWMTRLIHFFDNNENVGTVGLPLVDTKGFNSNDARWTCNPGRVGAAVGCAFAVRPSDLFQIKNPDGSMGFWDDLISFHEETTLGFRLAEQGKLSYMLPYPPVYHIGGASFGSSPELVWRQESPYMPKAQFLEYVRSIQWYVSQYEEQYEKGTFDRMSYSRAQFCKYFGIFDRPRMWTHPNGDVVDCYEEPQREIHERLVTPHEPRLIRWLDRDMVEKEAWDKTN